MGPPLGLHLEGFQPIFTNPTRHLDAKDHQLDKPFERGLILRVKYPSRWLRAAVTVKAKNDSLPRRREYCFGNLENRPGVKVLLTVFKSPHKPTYPTRLP